MATACGERERERGFKGVWRERESEHGQTSALSREWLHRRDLERERLHQHV
jgi:hypothetical protein